MAVRPAPPLEVRRRRAHGQPCCRYFPTTTSAITGAAEPVCQARRTASAVRPAASTLVYGPSSVPMVCQLPSAFRS